jgi:hypothetical protein
MKTRRRAAAQYAQPPEGADEGATGDAEGADEAAAMRPSGDAEGANEAAARRWGYNGLTSEEEAPKNAAPRATHGYHPVPVDPMRHPYLHAALRKLGRSASNSGMHPDDEELGWVLAYRSRSIPPDRMDYPWQSPASSRACPCVCHKTGGTEEERQFKTQLVLPSTCHHFQHQHHRMQHGETTASEQAAASVLRDEGSMLAQQTGMF